MRDYIFEDEYFVWLTRMISENRYSRHISYEKLLVYLHNTEFTYLLHRDENRASDGISLRYKFLYREYGVLDGDVERYGPCSVLEMMVALALRCEEEYMDDPSYGNRTGQWFWEMISSLGLGSMYDDNFDERYVEDTIDRFLNREYEPNGRGGLFTVRNCDEDLRTVEIWCQLCWYLDNIT